MFRSLQMTSLLVDVIWHIPVTAQKNAELTYAAAEAWSLLCPKVDVRLSSASAAVYRRRGQRLTLLLFVSTRKTDNGVADVLACEWLCAVEVSIAVLNFFKPSPRGVQYSSCVFTAGSKYEKFWCYSGSVSWKCHFERVKIRPREIILTSRSWSIC